MPVRASLLCLLLAPVLWPGALSGAVRWRDVAAQPAAWFATPEAAAVADNVLLYQHPSGGWPKNRDMTLPPADQPETKETEAPTIDNGATTAQLHFLARVHAAQPNPRWQAAIERGLDYLLAAQYDNGGWPQFYPLREGYYSHITYNDNAMVNVLTLLRDVAQNRPPFTTIDAGRRARAARAVDKGIACILRCQITVNGVKTAWCAQHDEHTLEPAPARRFEPVALASSESVGIVRFLMSLPQPTPEIIVAVEGAVAWFQQVKLTGVREDHPPAPTLPHGHDRVMVRDASAPPLWARFYEIGTNRPIYSGRDGVIRYNLAEVEPERRGGYAWHNNAPQKLLERDYPRWRQEHHLP